MAFLGRAALVFALAAALLLGGPLSSAAEPMSEYEVKAAFLFNFAKFVKWPETSLPESAASFNVCVLGDNAVVPAIEHTIGGKTLRDKPVVVKHLDGAEAARGCQILYVSASDGSTAAKVASSVAGASVLTIGETQDFAGHGGIIGFKTEDNKVRFEINPDGAKRANLEISSQLLKLATIVHDARN